MSRKQKKGWNPVVRFQPFLYGCSVGLLLYADGFFLGEVEDVLLVGLHALVVFAASHDDLLELAQTGSGGDEVTADDVLLHALEVVHLALDGGFVEHLGGLLERSGRHEALGLEGCTGDTLQDLRRSGGHGVAHLNGLQVAALQA